MIMMYQKFFLRVRCTTCELINIHFIDAIFFGSQEKQKKFQTRVRESPRETTVKFYQAYTMTVRLSFVKSSSCENQTTPRVAASNSSSSPIFIHNSFNTSSWSLNIYARRSPTNFSARSRIETLSATRSQSIPQRKRSSCQIFYPQVAP